MITCNGKLVPRYSVMTDHLYLQQLGIVPALRNLLGDFEVIETHLSIVVIGSMTALKFKKARQFPFVDYRTRDARIQGAVQEVTLNRRLSSTVYRGYVIVRDDCSLELVPQLPSVLAPTIREVGVWMKTVPSMSFLSNTLATFDQADAQLERIATTLARFHREAIHPPTDPTEYLASLRHHSEDNFTALREAFITSNDPTSLQITERVQQWSSHQLLVLAPVLTERCAKRYLVEGHGDLRAEHVVIEKDRVEFIDCIEFDSEYRVLDPIDEIAFLAMDLTFRDRPDCASLLTQHYQLHHPVPWNAELYQFFFAYRACVRAKIALLSSNELTHTPLPLSSPTRQLLALASRCTYPELQSRVVFMCGLAASGKTTLAEELAARFSLRHLQSDAIRREFAPTIEERRSEYSDERKELVYREQIRRADRILRTGGAVILDATFSSRARRAAIVALAQQHGTQAVAVYCHLDEHLALEWIRRRQLQGDTLSDAGPTEYEIVKRSFEPPSEGEGFRLLTVDSTRPLIERLTQVTKALGSPVVHCGDS